MKICFFTHTMNPRTGVGELSTQIISGLKTVLPDMKSVIFTSEDYLSLRPKSLLKHYFFIRSEIKKADCIHAIDAFPYGVLATFYNFGIGKPIIITTVGSGSIQQLHARGLRSLLLRFSYNQASNITAISRYIATEIKKIMPGLMVQVIHPGVDTAFWSSAVPTSLDSELRSRTPYMLSVGEFKRRKGYSELLPVIKTFLDNNPQANYIIVANTKRNKPYGEEIQGLIRKLGIEKRVTILSNVTREELKAIYTYGACYVSLPQNKGWDVEGFGIAILEAAASGLPAVIGAGSGADDAVLDLQSGFLVDSRNIPEVLEKLSLLVNDSEEREKFSKGAKLFAQNKTIEHQAQYYAEIYKKL